MPSPRVTLSEPQPCLSGPPARGAPSSAGRGMQKRGLGHWAPYAAEQSLFVKQKQGDLPLPEKPGGGGREKTGESGGSTSPGAGAELLDGKPTQRSAARLAWAALGWLRTGGSEGRPGGAKGRLSTFRFLRLRDRSGLRQRAGPAGGRRRPGGAGRAGGTGGRARTAGAGGRRCARVAGQPEERKRRL